MPKKKSDVVALTGGIGSGKSTVLAMFKSLGATVVDCDRIVHDLLEKNKVLLGRIRKKFGNDVFLRGRLDRKELGRHVFKSTHDRKILEGLVHPLVRTEIRKQVARSKRKITVVDIPLYFESGWEKRLKPVVVVAASHKKRFQRLQKKGLQMADILLRMKAQWPLEQKVRRADFVVNNNGSKVKTQKQINQIWKKILPQNERGKNGIRTR